MRQCRVIQRLDQSLALKKIVMDFRERLSQGIVLFDGAMGTEIHALGPTEQDYQGKLGCSEILNFTWSEQIQSIHERYLASGADVIETNTFGANQLVLDEYEIADQCKAINTAAVHIAKRACAQFNHLKPRFVAGSMGPGTKLASLGQITYDQLYESYRTQAAGLIQGGVDLFLVETCQDPLQIKATLHAIEDAQKEYSTKLPVGVSVTIEIQGTLLVGTEMSAVISILSPFSLAFLGMNCATGPDVMRPYVQQLSQGFAGPISVMPNAGLPKNISGKIMYALKKETFADRMMEFVAQEGVQIIGGCCGTTPAFIQELANRIPHQSIGQRKPVFIPSIASLYHSQAMSQEPRPLLIGERTNTNGCKEFKQYLLKEDWDAMVSVALEQQRTGAHALDLSIAYVGRKEATDMEQIVARIARQVSLPIVIDSTEVDVLESALKLHAGRCVINSINLETGEDRAHKICQLAKKYGAAVIALTIDEKGMALEQERKLEIAHRIYHIAIQQHELKPWDLIFDMLTFTLGSGDTSLKNSGIQTLEAIRRLKSELPGVYTVLGISNISFGLRPNAREVLNSVFLAEAVKAGLDMAIVHAKKIMPLYQIALEDREVAFNLLYNRGPGDPLLTLIDHFRAKEGITPKSQDAQISMSLEDKIKDHIVQGTRSGLDTLLQQKLASAQAIDIINRILIPAMKYVGELFASGDMQLPFVLQSAEVMKYAVDHLKPYLDKTQAPKKTSIVLATVRGDVHDIGKNLVDIILTNNGYQVYNLGIKCEIDTILQKALEVKADAIGMSGLLVKSTVVMKENLEEMKRRGIQIPVLLGGAALNRSYVDEVCASIVDSPVIYCSDAFEGLKAMKHIQTSTVDDYLEAMRSRYYKAQPLPMAMPLPSTEQTLIEAPIPQPPFWGNRIVTAIDLDTIFSYLTQEVLFRGRWGYRRSNMTKAAYEQMIEHKVKPEFQRLKTWSKDKNIFIPQVVYGYYPCQTMGQDVIIYHPETRQPIGKLNFPRQKKAPYRCIADFFKPVQSGIMDVIALQIVTIGTKAQEIAQELYSHDRYKEYLLFHGLSVETTEALAEYWHKIVRQELHIHQDGQGIEDFVLQKYQGSRYSFGYPSCPDMNGDVQIYRILQAERIGVGITESGQMVPEQTTSAFIAHHPQAKYFDME